MKPIGTDDCHSFTADRVTRENAAVRGVYTKICCRGSAAFMPGAPFRALFSGLFACARAQVAIAASADGSGARCVPAKLDLQRRALGVPTQDLHAGMALVQPASSSRERPNALGRAYGARRRQRDDMVVHAAGRGA